MAIFIIGDLHLGLSTDKPMDVFGDYWKNHHIKIAKDWRDRVNEEDLVILAGDTSWATTFEEADTDLTFVDDLPGTKLILKGNHDYWWTTLKKMQGKYASLHFLHNSAFVWGDYVIVGTRGWEPQLKGNEGKDRKIYERECIRLQLSIDAAPKDKEKIGVLHYPPLGDEQADTAIADILKAAGIKEVYFGHIHSAYESTRQGIIEDISYTLISCDYLDFKLHQIV